MVLVAVGCDASSSSPSRATEPPAGTSTLVSTTTPRVDDHHDRAHDDQQHDHDQPRHILLVEHVDLDIDLDIAHVSTTTTTTTAPPPVGQFVCTQHGQARSTWEVRPPSDLPSPEVPAGWTTTIAGRTVQGRDIDVFVRAVDVPRRRVLVIGGLHGNEPVTPPAVRGLLRRRDRP